MVFLIRKTRQILFVTKTKFYGRNFCNTNKGIILGIETSCDDTGCGIVDTEGNILGEALKSQHLVHLK